jgi:cytoskeleton protein RodZ
MAEEDGGQEYDSLTIGGRLRQGREARGLSLDSIASQTRIPLRHLRHIELEEWDALPAPTYAIGFARNYANAVGLDGAQIAQELRDRIGGVRQRAPAPEYFEPADPARVPPRWLALIAVLLAVVLVVGYLVWRGSLSEDETGTPDATVALSPATSAPSAAPSPAAPQPVAGQPVVLVATGEVWLRITDGPGGALLYSGSLAAGERFAIPATAQRPLLRTGRPQMLRATVGAQDLGPIEPAERTVTDVSLRAEDLAGRLRPTGTPAPQPAAAPGL